MQRLYGVDASVIVSISLGGAEAQTELVTWPGSHGK